MNAFFALSTKAAPAESGVCCGTEIILRILISPSFSLATLIAYLRSLSGFSGVYGIKIRNSLRARSPSDVMIGA